MVVLSFLTFFRVDFLPEIIVLGASVAVVSTSSDIIIGLPSFLLLPLPPPGTEVLVLADLAGHVVLAPLLPGLPHKVARAAGTRDIMRVKYVGAYPTTERRTIHYPRMLFL